jgi:hypothetical protein
MGFPELYSGMRGILIPSRGLVDNGTHVLVDVESGLYVCRCSCHVYNFRI